DGLSIGEELLLRCRRHHRLDLLDLVAVNQTEVAGEIDLEADGEAGEEQVDVGPGGDVGLGPVLAGPELQSEVDVGQRGAADEWDDRRNIDAGRGQQVDVAVVIDRQAAGKGDDVVVDAEAAGHLVDAGGPVEIDRGRALAEQTADQGDV